MDSDQELPPITTTLVITVSYFISNRTNSDSAIHSSAVGLSQSPQQQHSPPSPTSPVNQHGKLDFQMDFDYRLLLLLLHFFLVCRFGKICFVILLLFVLFANFMGHILITFIELLI